MTRLCYLKCHQQVLNNLTGMPGIIGGKKHAEVRITSQCSAFLSSPEMATLYVSPHPDDFRSLLALIAAEFCPSARPRTITDDPPASLNANSRPTLVLGNGEDDSVLCGSNAVSWYLANKGKIAGVDTKQQSQVWQWLSFADNELTPVSCAVVFPLMGVMVVDKKVSIQMLTLMCVSDLLFVK